MRVHLPAASGLAARRILLVLLAPVCVVALFNLAMALAAMLETSFYAKDPQSWRSASQILANYPTKEGPSVLLIHGFVGSPLDMKPLAQRLVQDGFRVVVPVIPGQLAQDSALSRGDILPGDYIAWLLQTIQHEREVTGQTPYLVGFSMGGALATCVARETGVERLVLIAPYYGLPQGDSVATKLARHMNHVVPLVPKLQSGKINDTETASQYSPGSYIISLKAFAHLQDLAAYARSVAPELPMPVLALVSPLDEVASAGIVNDTLGPLSNVRILTCTDSNHIILYDHDRDYAMDSIAAFLAAPDPLDVSFPVHPDAN